MTCDATLLLRLPQADKDLIYRQAHHCGLSASAFIRRSAVTMASLHNPNLWHVPLGQLHGLASANGLTASPPPTDPGELS